MCSVLMNMGNIKIFPRPRRSHGKNSNQHMEAARRRWLIMSVFSRWPGLQRWHRRCREWWEWPLGWSCSRCHMANSWDWTCWKGQWGLTGSQHFYAQMWRGWNWTFNSDIWVHKERKKVYFWFRPLIHLLFKRDVKRCVKCKSFIYLLIFVDSIYANILIFQCTFCILLNSNTSPQAVQCKSCV